MISDEIYIIQKREILNKIITELWNELMKPPSLLPSKHKPKVEIVVSVTKNRLNSSFKSIINKNILEEKDLKLNKDKYQDLLYETLSF